MHTTLLNDEPMSKLSYTSERTVCTENKKPSCRWRPYCLSKLYRVVQKVLRGYAYFNFAIASVTVHRF